MTILCEFISSQTIDQYISVNCNNVYIPTLIDVYTFKDTLLVDTTYYFKYISIPDTLYFYSKDSLDIKYPKNLKERKILKNNGYKRNFYHKYADEKAVFQKNFLIEEEIITSKQIQVKILKIDSINYAGYVSISNLNFYKNYIVNSIIKYKSSIGEHILYSCNNDDDILITYYNDDDNLITYNNITISIINEYNNISKKFNEISKK